jgi:hypothetical protein
MTVKNERISTMAAGVAATVLGLLGLACVLWIPTLAIALALLAVVVGVLGRRMSGRGSRNGGSSAADRLSFLGIVMGAAALAATTVVVVATTDF